LKLKCVLLISVATAFIMTACDAKPDPASSPLKPDSTAPASVQSPVATPISAASLMSPIPTPTAGQGVVTGVLIDQRTGQPAVKTILYLEPAMNHDVPSLLYGPLNYQPKTTSLGTGQFVITDVPPGEYVLVLYSPIDILFYQQADGSAVLVQVKPGEVTDLEKVQTFIP
jgi:hypothetical protein